MGLVVDATQEQLESMDTAGRQGLVALALTLAQALDDGAGLATAAVGRELRATLTQLEAGVDGRDGSLNELLDRLSAPVGDTADAKPANARGSRRSRR